MISNWQQQAQEYWQQKNYSQASRLYEQAIENEPDVQSHYWYLGLLLLLQGQEVEAQTTWLMAMTDDESEAVEKFTQDLIQVLETEAERQRLEIGDYTTAWVIRQHIREIHPHDINNLLHLMGLSALQDTYSSDQLQQLEILNILSSEDDINVDPQLLMQVLQSVFQKDPFNPISCEFLEKSYNHIKDSEAFISVLIPIIYQVAYSAHQYQLALKLTELGLQLNPKHPELLRCLASFYQDLWEFSKGIEAAKQCYEAMETFADKVYANFLLLRGLMSAGGRWDEFSVALKQHQSMLERLAEEHPTDLRPDLTVRLFASTFFFPYFQDQPQENLSLRRKVAELALSNVEEYAKNIVEKYRYTTRPFNPNNSSKQHLKIGYLSHCLRNHSVGWLARGLFQYHNRERFEIHTYLFAGQLEQSELQQWYINHSHKAYKFGLDTYNVVEKIYEDEIDILIDLDSMTLTNSCEAMAVKSAPIQATWLGWDTSCVPTIDYFIADPYVLPEDAENYYSEKIIRLPQTYLAVDGFEVGVPTLRREDLGIPSDAIVYFTTQRGYKYNPGTAELQIKILKAVPNSFFIIKGIADHNSLKSFYAEMAEPEGVSGDRFKILALAPSEPIHRANLAVADVVLDTYPYNGATTTMETLWMGIPMVTKVGQQFAARNSYTMMLNAGITEGIAWTDEEYVDWGIKLGTDEKLRQQVAWKLRQNRKTAPLWNAKQFTREMEKAYEQMWQKYIESKN